MKWPCWLLVWDSQDVNTRLLLCVTITPLYCTGTHCCRLIIALQISCSSIFLLNIIANVKQLLKRLICRTFGWLIKKRRKNASLSHTVKRFCQCPHIKLFESMIELINFNCNNQICKNRSSWMIQFEPPAESVSFWLILSGAAQSNGHSRGEGWEVIDSNLSVHKENISWGDGVCECVGVSLPLSVICEINNLYNGALLKAVIYQVTVSYCSLTCLLSLSHAHTTHYTHTLPQMQKHWGRLDACRVQLIQ